MDLAGRHRILETSTVFRRSQQLDLALNRVPANQPIHLIIDSTGLSIVGQGEWAAAKYGGRGKRAWKKLHIGVDESGSIVTEALTHGSADDAKTALDLIWEVEAIIACNILNRMTILGRPESFAIGA